jgi:hypothetical protein
MLHIAAVKVVSFGEGCGELAEVAGGAVADVHAERATTASTAAMWSIRTTHSRFFTTCIVAKRCASEPVIKKGDLSVTEEVFRVLLERPRGSQEVRLCSELSASP